MFICSEHEALKWEVEERQLRERHLMSKSQLKETFFLQRSQMVNRHDKVRLYNSSMYINYIAFLSMICLAECSIYSAYLVEFRIYVQYSGEEMSLVLSIRL